MCLKFPLVLGPVFYVTTNHRIKWAWGVEEITNSNIIGRVGSRKGPIKSGSGSAKKNQIKFDPNSK